MVDKWSIAKWFGDKQALWLGATLVREISLKKKAISVYHSLCDVIHIVEVVLIASHTKGPTQKQLLRFW